MSLPAPSSASSSAGGAAASTPVTGEERQAFAKLEALKEIRSKTIGLEKLRLRLLHDLDSIESEDKCLSEYRREMELLQQEKMAHVEELRQIHADINAMETVMKQAEEAKRQASDSARRIIEDYSPLKHEVDLMRVELLGLDKLPEIPSEDKERLGAVGLLDKPKSLSLADPAHPWHHPPGADPNKPYGAPGGGPHFGPPAPGGVSGRGDQPSGGHPHNPFLAAAAAQHQAMGLGPLGLASAAKADQLRTSLTAQAATSSAIIPPPQFRYDRRRTA